MAQRSFNFWIESIARRIENKMAGTPMPPEHMMGRMSFNKSMKTLFDVIEFHFAPSIMPVASTTQSGIFQLATNAEAIASTVTNRVISASNRLAREKSYKEYVALLSYVGVSLTVDVLQNTISPDLTWTQILVGYWRLESASDVFTNNKTLVYISSTHYNAHIQYTIVNTKRIEIVEHILDFGWPGYQSEGGLYLTPVLIRVFA